MLPIRTVFDRNLFKLVLLLLFDMQEDIGKRDTIQRLLNIGEVMVMYGSAGWTLFTEYCS